MSTDKDALIDLVSAVSGETFLKVEESFGDGYVRLRTSEAERRQAKHDIRTVEDVVVELLRNARDAHARQIFVATSREGDLRSIVMLDDGVGIPATMQERIFEPRVTSKLETMVVDRWGVHGRGMALYSVRSNVSDVRVVNSDLHRGTSIAVTADTAELTERTDQSSWPTVERGDSGDPVVVRGPHNIVRRILEFACEHPEVDVYYGSPVEIVTTLTAVGRPTLDSADILFADDISRIPLWQRPAAAADASDLAEIAESIGLAISERTAHRIFAAELAPLEPAITFATCSDDDPQPQAEPDIYKDRRGLKIHHSDLTEFQREVTAAFDRLAERYYLHLGGDPKVTVGRAGITVRFPVEKDE
ncbi:MAG: ATP-binding protein [Actinobacteria bacterium HGW-Actinobacteria-9]|nr:MAG: ATP-binding protein [Actinobacteria bacterium HGW-Actinobacteria-9]